MKFFSANDEYLVPTSEKNSARVISYLRGFEFERYRQTKTFRISVLQKLNLAKIQGHLSKTWKKLDNQLDACKIVPC